MRKHEKHVKKDPNIGGYSTLEIHTVNFLTSNFVFACLYFFLNIYYKYIIFSYLGRVS